MSLGHKIHIDQERYHEVTVSIQYRLIKLRFDVDNVNETIRLALLVFAGTLFFQIRGVKTRYEYLAQRIKSAFTKLMHRTGAVAAWLTLWLYVIGAVSVFGGHGQAWLRPALAEELGTMKISSWNEVRLSLKSLLWVNVLHDPPAKKIVEATLLQP